MAAGKGKSSRYGRFKAEGKGIIDGDPGESEAIILAMEVRPERLLIDESAGRAVARRMGIIPLGVLGLLVRAKQNGLISAVGPLMERLVKEIDFRVAPSIRLDVLREAGE